jgi:sugar/nucleoside kinase (ribokinase family)
LDMISFGSVFLELVFGHVHTLPGPGEEVFTDEFAVSCGGAVTCASAAARAGVQAGLCTVLGDDLGSGVVQEFCARRGVDLGPSLRVRRRSAGITVALNFDGDRAFVTHIPPRPVSEQPEVERWRGVLRRDQPRWCYLHGGTGVPDFLRQAREQGARTVLDVSLGDERKRDLVIECVRLADLFVPNEAELLRLTRTGSTESAVAAAREWGTPMVITRGAAGALVVDPDGVTEVRDGVGEVEVRDLTGAGDTFAGAMIGALAQGAPLRAAVVAANAAGSQSVGRLGAVGEVEVAGFSSAGRTLGAMFVENVAAAAAKQAVAKLAAGPEQGGPQAAGGQQTAGQQTAGQFPAGQQTAARQAAEQEIAEMEPEQ